MSASCLRTSLAARQGGLFSFFTVALGEEATARSIKGSNGKGKVLIAARVQQLVLLLAAGLVAVAAAVLIALSSATV